MGYIVIHLTKNIISEVKNIDDKVYAFVENKKIIMDQAVCWRNYKLQKFV